MNICDTCGYKVISNARFEEHKLGHVNEPVKEIPVEVIVGDVAQDPIQPVSEDIFLKFIKPVEIRINGIEYFGKEITVKNMSLASEIVRIAREAYGPTILA